MKLNTLQALFHHQLKDLYSAENHLLEALPSMAEAASHPELKAVFEEHLIETKAHVKRLDLIGAQLGLALNGHKCKGMEGLIDENEDLINDATDETVLDASLIVAAQRVTHYEIAAYGTAIAHASQLDLDAVALVLEQILDEEEVTNSKLIFLAELTVNQEAALIEA